MVILGVAIDQQWLISNLIWSIGASAVLWFAKWLVGWKFADTKRRILFVVGIPIAMFFLLALARQIVTGGMSPELEGNILTVTIVPTTDATVRSAALLIAANIRNTGAPSIIDGYRLRVSVPTAKDIDADLVAMASPISLPRGAAPGALICPTDSLFERTVYRPLATGGQIRGFLLFQVTGFGGEDLMRAGGTKYVLSFSDVRQRQYKAEHVWTPAYGSMPFIPGLNRQIAPVPVTTPQTKEAKKNTPSDSTKAPDLIEECRKRPEAM